MNTEISTHDHPQRLGESATRSSGPRPTAVSRFNSGGLAAGLRSCPFGRYVIFYEPSEAGTDVVRVLYNARDIDAVFGAGQ